jgi:hypothetical protein
MSTVQEIERAIERLSEEEVGELRQWLWDHDIARDAEKGLLNEPAEEALREHRSSIRAIEAALDRLPPEQLREVGDWIAARLMPGTTPAMLAALDEGIHSLKTEPAVPAEEVRKKIKEWSTV